MASKSKKWPALTPEEVRPIREKINRLIKEEGKSWGKVADEIGLDRSNLKVTVERQATYLNKFLNLMGYKIEFKKVEENE